MTTAERIAELRRELATLEAQQRAELVAAIVLVVGNGHCFSAAELFAHQVVSPPLAEAFTAAGIHNARQLGKKLRALGLERVGDDEHGRVWMCAPTSILPLV